MGPQRKGCEGMEPHKKNIHRGCMAHGIPYRRVTFNYDPIPSNITFFHDVPTSPAGYKYAYTTP
jgi:hypothetical protein